MNNSPNTYFDASISSLNLLSGLAEHTGSLDLILRTLQLGANYSLSPEQVTFAKASALELAGNRDITVLDIVKTWEVSPVLAEFAKNIKLAFLP